MPDRGSDPLVSVLMTVYNGGRFLRPAVESILTQTYENFEFVIINDGSTDGSRDYLDEVAKADTRIRVFHRENRGLTRALNEGLQLCRGPFVARMDSDDVSKPDRLLQQLRYLRRHPNIAAVGSATTLVDHNGTPLRIKRYPTTPASIRVHLRNNSALAHPAVMMRRDCVIGVGGYRAMIPFAQDYDLWLRLSEQYDLANLPEPLVKYRTHGNSVSVARAADQIVCRRMAQFSAAQRRLGKPDPLDDPRFSFADALAAGQAREAGTAAACDLISRWIGTGDPRIRNTLQDILDGIARGGLYRAILCKTLLRSLPDAAAPGRKSVAAAAMALLLRPLDLRGFSRILLDCKQRRVR